MRYLILSCEGRESGGLCEFVSDRKDIMSPVLRDQRGLRDGGGGGGTVGKEITTGRWSLPM